MSPKGRWKYLKFVTCTWPARYTFDPEPDMKRFKSMWAKTRPIIAEHLKAVGGTDVIEVVSKQLEDGRWHHHIHTHGLWCAPYVSEGTMRQAFEKAGVGRFEYTVLKESTYSDGKPKSALWSAIDYLAKYISKSDGAKRQVWGALRSWKEYLPEGKCSLCVKTTRDVEKKEQCQCSTNGRAC